MHPGAPVVQASTPTGGSASRLAPQGLAGPIDASDLLARCAASCAVAPSGPTGRSFDVLPGVPSPTGTNFFVSNWSGEGMITVNPSDPLNLVAGGLYQAPASWNNSTVWKQVGVSGAFTSFDGGKSWLVQELPPLPEFANASNPECGHVHLADSVLAFGPNDTVYYLDLSYYSGYPSVPCTGSLAGTGLYATVSADGGLTWKTPRVVAGANSGASIDKPWVAVDPRTGEAYVAYTDDGNASQIYLQRSNDSGAHWSSPELISSGTDSMRGVELAVDPWGGVDATWVDQSTAKIYFCRSNDSGTSFSAPSVAAAGPTAYSSPSPDAFRAYMLPALGVDDNASSPYRGRLYVSWQNGSGGASGSPFVSMSSSSDNGTHWSSPVRVDHLSTEDFQPDVTAGPDGTVYVEWYGENSTSGHYRLFGAVSGDGGRTFSPAAPVSDVDSYPQYASGGGGNAWWIGDYTDAVSAPGGAWAFWTDARSPLAWSCSPCLWGYTYNISFYAAEMTRIMLSSSVPVNASVTGSTPLPAPVALGNATRGVLALVHGTFNLSVPSVVDANGTVYYFAVWYGSSVNGSANVTGTVGGPIDLRACYTTVDGGPCTEPGAPGRITVQASPANATIRVNGTDVRADPSGFAALWEPPGTYPVSVAATNFVTQRQTVTVTPGSTTSLSFHLEVAPGALRGTVSPTGASLSLSPNGTVVRGTLGRFQSSLLPGHYLLTANRSGYAPTSFPLAIAANNTTWANVTLTLLPPGTLEGLIGPPGAAATLNGSPLPLSPSGSFSRTLPPGIYWVNASDTGYQSASSGPVVVGSGQVAYVALMLQPLNGTVAGWVDPASTTVSVNGTPVGVVDSNFSVSLAPGPYTFRADAPGFVGRSVNVTVAPGGYLSLNLQLNVSVGWLVATVTPDSATASLSGRPVPVHGGGTINLSLLAGGYRLQVTAAGYSSATVSFVIHAGRATSERISLLPLQEAGSTLWSTLGWPLLLGIVAAAAAGVLLFFGLRRRRTVAPRSMVRRERGGSPPARTRPGAAGGGPGPPRRRSPPGA